MSLSNLEEVSVESVLLEEPAASVVPATPADVPTRSYHPYSWSVANRVLDVVDTLTGGRAGMLQRLSSYVVIGGVAAVVNLIVYYIVYHFVPVPGTDTVHLVVAFLCATEISIMANFVPNDYFTFRHVAGARQRSWLQRCLRFQLTCISGSALTALIQFSLVYLVHVWPLFAQASALIIVLFYNFTVHHLFTYRHVKTEKTL
ncbi:hypothetical protein KSD_39260 [Ktedonobacter sp. SOSP1-85]|uniref:GtrA family protein n=1 Tax=Ktedonobacter sp. SOSP1-85 TaxID=2778367 RepID=UPI001915DE41|nr:GtrA family protein [Ktedonobacter sp. SOSP1-85]GHO76155.1 hypothetical protein KSD_39260 [Ktedonobacter sp. SOSP1-85]